MATVSTYLGLFLLAMSTLMYEILITRIFSVTTWYHFAFLSISVALFGLAAGGILVYVKPAVFTPERTRQHLGASSLLFAGLSLLAMIVHLYCPALLGNASADIVIPVSLLLTLPFAAAAFTASGTGIALALTRFPARVNYLYAADLLGAALGCLSIVFTLRYVDAITDIFLVSCIASLAALCFTGKGARQLTTACVAACVVFGALTIAQAVSYVHQSPIVNVAWSKGRPEQKNLFQLWNSFSRVRVFGNSAEEQAPDPYGLSPKVANSTKIRMLYLDIDGGAATPILHFDGNTEPVAYLASEISNVAHHLRKNANVLVIGAGGGKDVLSGLVMKQNHVTAVEINENVIRSAYQHFADFSGALARNPRVELVNEEARSYITRTKNKFDIIQISMIDTWAATASGAYSLAENGLYTTDSFKTLINHLTDHGVLTVSRWYAHAVPAEFYRLTALAATSLKELGIANPEQHIMAFRIMPKPGSKSVALAIPDGIGTLLISKSPFTADDYAMARQLATEKDFELVFAGETAADPLEARLAHGEDPAAVGASIPFNLKAPTDDSPFFFQTLSLARLLEPGMAAQNMNIMNVLAAGMLLIAFVFTTILTVYCVRIPYVMSTNKQSVARATPLFVYFFAIGAGFMFVEISQIQRLSIFLGHPVYGLAVVLFALLLSTGAGSFLSEHWLIRRKLDVRASVIGILCVLVAYAAVSPFVLEWANLAAAWQRIVIGVMVLCPLGMLLGTAFPVGMKVASESEESALLTPWLWGINGASSVCTSVLAVVVSMFAGISISFCCGIGCYIIALLALNSWKRTDRSESTMAGSSPK